MSIVWKIETPLPARLFREFSVYRRRCYLAFSFCIRLFAEVLQCPLCGIPTLGSD